MTNYENPYFFGDLYEKILNLRKYSLKTDSQTFRNAHLFIAVEKEIHDRTVPVFGHGRKDTMDNSRKHLMEIFHLVKNAAMGLPAPYSHRNPGRVTVRAE